MVKPGAAPNRERLLELLAYEAESGLFAWKLDRRGHVKAGDPAGSAHGGGYRNIKFDGKKYLAHRVAWLYVTGEWPEEDIDHRNRDRVDNRFANLRVVTRQVNLQNQARPKSHSTSPYLGVTRDKGGNRWVAQIQVGSMKTWLGTFGTSEEASAAYLAAKRNLHVGCTI